MESLQYVYVMYISSSTEIVWNALIDPKMTAKYWQHENVSDWTPGSMWEHRGLDKEKTVHMAGKVVEFFPPRRMVLTWAYPVDRTHDKKHSRVTIDLETVHDVTRMTVTHDKFEGNPAMSPAIAKWWPKVMSSLKSLLETGRPLPELW